MGGLYWFKITLMKNAFCEDDHFLKKSAHFELLIVLCLPKLQKSTTNYVKKIILSKKDHFP